jgi:hypothetical protein
MSEPYTPRASFLALENFRSAYLGHKLPDSPPLPDFTHIKDPAPYAGTYHSKDRTLTLVAKEHHLVLICDDQQQVILEDRGAGRFYANHPEWNLFPIQLQQTAKGEGFEVFYGPHWFVNEHYSGPKIFPISAEWEVFCGHYRSHNPWESNFRIFERKGQLYYCAADGNEEVLIQTADGAFRIGEDEYIPEQIVFDQVVEGKALRAVHSGCAYYRFFTP